MRKWSIMPIKSENAVFYYIGYLANSCKFFGILQRTMVSHYHSKRFNVDHNANAVVEPSVLVLFSWSCFGFVRIFIPYLTYRIQKILFWDIENVLSQYSSLKKRKHCRIKKEIFEQNTQHRNNNKQTRPPFVLLPTSRCPSIHFNANCCIDAGRRASQRNFWFVRVISPSLSWEPIGIASL